ncbi:MAG: 4Fe-4S dicluster domain-containing protein [bacterium]|nr:4Fe-4S dicluster domain-containing protein [bacterium]
MGIDRRGFFKHIAGIGAAAVSNTTKLFGQEYFAGYPDRFGVLFDLTVCIGCRKCEWACNDVNKLPNKSIEEFEDKSVFAQKRRPQADTFTIVNRFDNPKNPERPLYIKNQCMHCNEPACVSACPVNAFTKTALGAVIYNPSLCFGCRYCMAVCPFNIPAYQYNDAFTPEVTKCTFCFDRIRKQGGVPACVQICPVEALIFGNRRELRDLAHEKIRNHRDRYVNHVYGEHEVGGTSWMYISPIPFDKIGFRTDLGTKPIPQYSRGFLSLVSVVVVSWPALFMGFYCFSKRRQKLTEAKKQNKNEEKK